MAKKKLKIKQKKMDTMAEVSKHFEEFSKREKLKEITEKDFDTSLKKVIKRGTK